MNGDRKAPRASDPQKPGSEGDPDLPEGSEIVDPGELAPDPGKPDPGAGKPGSLGNPDVPGETRFALALVAMKTATPQEIAFRAYGGAPPYELDPGDGGDVVEFANQATYTYDEPGTYEPTVIDGEGDEATVTVTADDQPAEFALVWPTDGATMPPVFDIFGTGAAPGASVTLWSDDRDPAVDPANATTTADEAGLFGFTGDEPQAVQTVTWHAESDGKATAPVTVTIDAET